ncbi:hypothetical protein GCM10017562_59900 [Streptomyces roseofulvus]|uniref:hypothetical protein n=1 Tax=Streptomyces roseofulvus TaxID=33902 RepID=UPI0031FC6F8F
MTTPGLTPAESAESARLIETAYRDDRPPKPTGAAPVPQPGRAPMSARSTELATLCLCAGAGVGLAGAGTSAVLLALGTVPASTLAVAAGGPVALALAGAVLVKTMGRAARDVAAAAPPVNVVTNHYNGASTHTHHTAESHARTVFGRASAKSRTR